LIDAAYGIYTAVLARPVTRYDRPGDFDR